MRIAKAVITAAAPYQRRLPLQTLVDRDGCVKSVLQIIAEEALSAGVEDIAVVVCPGDEEDYAESAGGAAARLQFVPQDQPRGYGYALWCARSYVGDAPFLHFVSDHLYVGRAPRRAAQVLVETAAAESCSVSAVQATRENMLAYYGTVGGRRVPQREGLYEIERVIEKPTPTEAEQTLLVPGLRAGHYLCFFGMHVLTPAVMELLDEEVRAPAVPGPIHLSTALARLSGREKHLALELPGRRYNVGVTYGLFMAQLALALEGDRRQEVLAQMVELLAERHFTEG
jgi:UTP--glucose-1-phosphate uridylyltransferase